MVEGKKRKKLKKLVKKEPTIQQKSSQKAQQITKVNIKIGDDKKQKRKRRRKKKTGGGGGGAPQRIVRRNTNPYSAAINYTPPPGYLTPGDIRALYAAPPQLLPPAVLPQAPVVDGQPVGQLVEGQPVAVQARPGIVQPQGRPRVSLQERVVGFGPAAPAPRRTFPAPPPPTSAIYGPRSAGAGLGGLIEGSNASGEAGQGMNGVNTGATAFIGGRPLPQASTVVGGGGSHRAELAELHLDAAGSPGGAVRLFGPAAMSTRQLRNRAIVVPSGAGGAAASGGAIPVVRRRRGLGSRIRDVFKK